MRVSLALGSACRQTFWWPSSSCFMISLGDSRSAAAPSCKRMNSGTATSASVSNARRDIYLRFRVGSQTECPSIGGVRGFNFGIVALCTKCIWARVFVA